ncbi:biotin synthase BioB [Ammonifex thiophilus]|uniref:Biotin synthase n=1 Tax=Ammonifex thiophilus TaxID=444093 RepID=A0A3D8P4Q5_9THEO|nr:biotin synthase BioB [Ammonifex thiophilus]RDV84213.1 biotin synthase BioB [Ammonifex thiophilus]
MKELVRLQSLAERVLAGENIGSKEAEELFSLPPEYTPLLLGFAHLIKLKFRGKKVSLCAIVNARSGRCPEDCRFCAQSVHYKTRAPSYPLLPEEEVLEKARLVYRAGIRRFSLVTSGPRPGKDFERLCRLIRLLKKELPGLKVCASLGALNRKEALELKEAGLDRYHHNLETSPSFFPRICTTHRFEDRLATCWTAAEAGLELCSGGIIGLGESPAQRWELALALRELPVVSVPVNILHPIPGTPLENQLPLSPEEILRSLAVFRFLLPRVALRYAGGREFNLRDTQGLGLWGGVDGMITGNYLTTPGQGIERDLKLLTDLGLEAEP